MQKSLVYYHSENRATSQIWKVLPNMVFPPIWGEKMAAFWACACKLSWTLLSPARVQPLYVAGRKESSGTGLDLRRIGLSAYFGKLLTVLGSLSVRTIEKAGGRWAGSGREKGGTALSFSLPDPARHWSRLSPARFFDRPHWPRAWSRLCIMRLVPVFIPETHNQPFSCLALRTKWKMDYS